MFLVDWFNGFDLQGFAVSMTAITGLFLLPGFFLSGLIFPREHLGLGRIPLGFSLILALFFILFLLSDVLGLGWTSFQWIWIIATVALVVSGSVYWIRPGEHGRYFRLYTNSKRFVFLFVVLLTLGSLITVFTPRDEDDWSYFQIVRNLADSETFPLLSPSGLRNGLNVWWLFHALIVRMFQVNLVSLGRDFLPLLLVPLCFLSFYALARTLFQDRRQALGALTLQFIFYLLDLFFQNADVELTGFWFLVRVDQDHTIVQFLFLPVYILTAFRYIENRSKRWLVANFLALATVTAVHPQGLIQAGVLVFGFIGIYIAIRADRERWFRSVTLLLPYFLLLLALVPFLAYWVDYSNNPVFDLSRLAVSQTNFPYTFRWVTFFSRDWFILRPDFLLHPYLLALIGLAPWLIQNTRRDLVSQYLLGSTLALMLILYVPFTFNLVSKWIGWSIFRFWYLFPIALTIVHLIPLFWQRLSMGWRKLRARLWDRDSVVSILCLSGLVLVGARFPTYLNTLPTWPERPESSPDAVGLLTALRQFSDTAGGTVLAPRAISDAIPAYRATLTPILFRYNTPQEKIDDANEFYASPVLTSFDLTILRKYQAIYLIVPTYNQKISQIDLSENYFQLLYRNEAWALYRVHSQLDENELVLANTHFAFGDWQLAVKAYQSVLRQSPDSSLAYTGLGILLMGLGQSKNAVQELERAVQIAPENRQAHCYLARLYVNLGVPEKARTHLAIAKQMNCQ